MPVLESSTITSPIREATVHHSINGSFAIRKEQWKLIMCPGSGGWSYPKPNDTIAIASLPNVQLYDLLKDPKETTNLEAAHPVMVKELKGLLSQYITEGRSTPGKNQKNDPSEFA